MNAPPRKNSGRLPEDNPRHEQPVIADPQAERAMMGRRTFVKNVLHGALTLAGFELGRERAESASWHFEMDASGPVDQDRIHEDLRPIIRADFERQNALYFQILRQGGLNEYFHALADHDAAFFPEEAIRSGTVLKCSCCSDEGNKKILDALGRPMLLHRSPGSDVPLGLGKTDPLDPRVIEDVARKNIRLGVTNVTGHRACGAKKKVLQQFLVASGKMSREQARDISYDKVDAFDKQWTDAVVAKMNALGVRGAQSSFITDLARDLRYHRARMLIRDDTNRYDSSFKGIPPAYVQSDEGQTTDEIFTGAKALMGIAFDEDHSFGKEFAKAPGKQFVFANIAPDQKRLKQMNDEAHDFLRTLDPDIRERTRIDGISRRP